MTFPHLSQLRELQEENANPKRMYADLALMDHALKDVVDRKLWPRSVGLMWCKLSWPTMA
jgi:hypothetical protein